VTVELLRFGTGTSTTVTALNIDLVAGAGTTVFFCADGKVGETNPTPLVAEDAAPSGPSCTPFASILNASGCEITGTVLGVLIGWDFPHPTK
jgi:hypothetical protein